MKTLIFVNDLSAAADCIRPWAENFAATSGAKLITWLPFGEPEKVPVGKRPMISVATQQQAMAPIVVSIGEMVRHYQADGVIMATTGNIAQIKDLTRQFFFRTHCPLILVPVQAARTLPGHIVYLTDLRFARQEIIHNLRRLAKKF